MNKQIIDIQLSNLLLDLQKDTSVKGVHKQITDSLRSITQDYQKYTITKNVKEIFEEYGIVIPDTINQSERQKYSNELKKTSYPKSNLVNSTFLNIEHFLEIKTMKNHLLRWERPENKMEAICYLKNYFKNNVICFFKLTKKDEDLKPGMNLKKLKNRLVDPDSIKMEI